jgi:acyl-CoA reductase-like NAD-dependent aldehyde dehydrogenase
LEQPVIERDLERLRAELLSEPWGPFIDGSARQAAVTLDTFDPARGSVLAHLGIATDADVTDAVEAAVRGFDQWRNTPPSQRARLIWRLADLLDQRREEFAAVEVLDSGKPYSEASAVDIPFAAEVLRYYAGWATKIAGRILPNSGHELLTLSTREPVGVVAAITPWNFPLLQVVYKLAPALAAGCSVVIKPSELASLSTLRLMRLVAEVGFPPGIVNVVVGGPEVGRALVRHPAVAKVAFTGQTETGQAIAREAGPRFARMSLELGGKSPHIILSDADLDRACAAAHRGIFFNQGEVCVAGSRLLVQRSVADAVVERLAASAESVRIGAGSDPTTEMGPLISAAHRERVAELVDAAQADGARIVTGGAPPDDAPLREGYFYRPTVLSDVTNRMAIAQTEVFGPVLSVIEFDDPDEAVHLANEAVYGLAAGIWTANTSLALHLSGQLEVGTVWINMFGRFDAAVPFGGRKSSGTGRELGEEGLDEYVRAKSVWVDLGVR